MTSRLADLHRLHGQSPWLDNLQRRYLTSGHLAALIRDGVRGLTSNPTIFQKAIQGSSDYDASFTAALSRGLDPEAAYWELVLDDIRAAADAFRPLYDGSMGSDGFVSVEVDPRLSRDSAGTERAAVELWERADRPNVMIKIPATREGLPAIRNVIAQGINVNVTLIFGLERYAEVIDAYMAGLEDRIAHGLSPSRIASVASFFVSRVDSEIDARLSAKGSDSASGLLGRAAVAQAVLAYRLFRDRSASSRWRALSVHGASVQRPLWASTSTKNPAYPDTLYVDSLIGPDTVNTLPDATLEAFADHGTLARTVDLDVHAAHETWAALRQEGINPSEIAAQLEREGLASFVASFEDLLSGLRAKAEGRT